MAIPFTEDEIWKVIAKIKPSKSPGCDEIPAELINTLSKPCTNKSQKYTTPRAETGDTPREITYGILKSLQ